MSVAPTVPQPPIVDCFDMCEPPGPELVDSYNPLRNRFPSPIAVDGALGVAATQDAVVALGLSDPAAPEVLGWLPHVGGTVHASVAGETVTLVVTTGVLGWSPAESDRERAVGELELPGQAVQAHRRAGMLFVESRDDAAGTMWLTSVDLSQPMQPALVSQLEFPYAEGAALRWRALAVFEGDRIYVVRPQGASHDAATTTIQVVDTSGADGVLRLRSAEIVLDGAVAEGQLAEHAGVVEVITGPARSGASELPVQVSTFAVDGLAPLGQMEVAPGPRESFYAGAVAGSAAYVLAADGSGSRLHVVDLAQPSAPALNAIDLGMARPYTVELVAAGDRVLVRHGVFELDGPVLLSLYEVAGQSPLQLGQVELAGPFPDYGLWYVDELGTAVIAHSASGPVACSTNQDMLLGVVQVTPDGLRHAGDIAAPGFFFPMTGAAGRLLLTAAGRIGSIDPAAPVDPAWTPIALVSSAHLAVGDDAVTRIATVEWSDAPLIDVVELEHGVEPPTSTSELVATDGAQRCKLRVLDLFQTGQYAFATAYEELREERTRRSVIAIDLSEARAPRIIATAPFPDTRGRAAGNEFLLGATQDAIVLKVDVHDGGGEGFQQFVEWIDVSDPAAARARSVELPEATLGLGEEAAVLDGTIVAATRAGQVGAGRRYWLDRVDLSDPGEAQVLPPVQVPGVVLGYDAQSARALVRRQSANGLELVVVTLDGDAACIAAQQPVSAGRFWVNDRAFAGLQIEPGASPGEYSLLLGTWDEHAIRSAVQAIPAGSAGEVVLAGTRVLVQGRTPLVYDAACPEAEPIALPAVVVADDARSDDPLLLMREATGLVPVPASACAAP
jgi:hypothetical protein